MTTEAPERTQELPPVEPEEQAPAEAVATELQPVNPLLTSVAVFLSTAAAGWMAAGIFRGAFANVVAIIGPAIGAGAVALSYRTRRPSLIQYLALPAAVAVGAILVVPDATGGTANLPGLVAEAIRTGGVAQPPIAFDPGWRFILVVLTAVLAAAGASLATGLNRPKLGIFLPIPLVFAAALVQPKEGSTLTTAISLGLVVGALAVSYGVELAREGATSGGFELRRLGRGAGVVAVLMVVLFALAQAGFLFPDTDRDQIIPPKRPEPQPPQPDRVIFRVDTDRTVPWRLGVLDVYMDNAWMLPPFDTSRFLEIPPTGEIPEPGASADRDTMEVTFTIEDVEGHVVPTISFAQSVVRDGFALDADPRTQTLRLPESRARRGMTYTVTAPVPPSAKEMADSPAPGPALAEFLEAPPPPSEVVALLDRAPTDNRFERLQFVRNEFFTSVIAAGQGEPVDLPPFRVADMLAGGEATPYEITAAEALLARWAGIPARIGYGFFGGERASPDSQTLDIRPKHGSTWLEAYFEGIGWVPVLGTPPRAKSSLSEQERNPDPEIRPTDELALTVYVPIRLQSIQLLFVVVRYWVLVTLPIVIGALLAFIFFTGPVKIIRGIRRRRWASDPRERVLVAYANFRDAANDLNVTDPTATPLNFLESLAPDDEHTELAWLVTRALWGDLGRDLRREDAEAAEDMAASVTRRLRRGQPVLTRVLGVASRASLRDPYTTEVPNLWPSWARAGVTRRAVARLNPWRFVRRLLPIGGAVLLLLLGACGGSSDASTAAQITEPVLPDPIAPTSLDGLRFQREEDAEAAYETVGDEGLVAEGRVFTIRDGDEVKAALQVGAFRPGLEATDREIREGVLGDIGSGRFELTRVGAERMFRQDLPEQTILLWFPPRLEYYELFVATKGFEQADRMFAAILAFQRGEETSDALSGSRGPLDPRRGGPL